MEAHEDAERAGRIRCFLAALLETWAAEGWDAERGGFFERLDPARRPVPAFDYRRLHLAARQLFVFCRGPALAGRAPLGSRAHEAYRYLRDRFRDPVNAGWLFKVDLDGNPADARKDLYGHAFVLFALAHYHASHGSAEALELARTTHLTLERHLLLEPGWLAASASADWTGRAAALQQNPHMHLFEAYLALEDATGEPAWRGAADRLASLFAECLYDPVSGVLPEFYDEAGRPHPETGHIVEPGHHFEWCWLLHVHARRRGRPPPEAAGRLFDWALRHGVDPVNGGIYDQLSREGRVLSPAKRIWPVTECIKAHAARWTDHGDPAARDGMRYWLDFLFERYLLPNGHWYEHLECDLRPKLDEMPGTTPYHLLMAFSEALPILERAD